MKKHKILAVGLSSMLLLGVSSPILALSNANIAQAAETNSTLGKLDYNNLADGEYTINFVIKNAGTPTQNSMADGAVQKPAKLVVKNGEYRVHLNFVPLYLEKFKMNGYLGDLYYYDKGERKSSEIVSYYNPDEIDKAFDVYKKAYPQRTAYPKELSYPLNKSEITANGILQSRIAVYVPIMASISEALGTQDALPIFDFTTLKVVKLDNVEKKEDNNKEQLYSNEKDKDKNSTEKTTALENKEQPKEEVPANRGIEEFVNISIKDAGHMETDVRRATEKSAQIIEKNGQKYLVITYYNKQNWGADHKYDNGLMNVWYNYDGGENKTQLTPKVIETGEHYQISQVEIPLQEKNNIHLFGEVLVNPIVGITKITSGVISIGDRTVATNQRGVENPNLLRVSQIGSILKDKSEQRLPFDYEKNGKIYSPYTADNGTKFKLADGRYAVELNFERKALADTDLRYIKYTLDGTEPTMESMSADLRSQSSDRTLPNSLYRIFVEPLADVPNFTSAGGDVTLKVKGFNLDGSVGSATQTLTLPFSKQYVDEVDAQIKLANNNYEAKLTSNNNYSLTPDANIKVEDINNTVKEDITKKINELGLANATTSQISIVDKNGAAYTPAYLNGWQEDANPILKLDILGYDANNQQVYLYKNGELGLLATSYSKYSGKYNISINQQSGIYVFATKNSKDLMAENLEKLKAKVGTAKEILAVAESTDDKVKLEQEVEKADKTLGRKASLLRLDNIVRHIENIDKYVSAVKNAKENEAYIKEKAKVLKEIVEQNILEKIITTEQYDKITKLKQELVAKITDAYELKPIIEQLEAELAELQYKHKVQNIEYLIEHYSKPEVASMASGVFQKDAKLIFAEDKTYLELNLQPMTVLTLRAHLTDLDVFKDELDKEEFNVYTLAKFEDSDVSGKINLFDKKLLIELDKHVKNSYDVRLGNDGMGGAKPQARLVIKSEIEQNIAELVDEATAIKVENNNLTSDMKLRVTRQDANTIATLANKNVDLYNIDITTKKNDTVVEISGTSKVTVPKKAGQKVAKVYYVSSKGELQERKILGQTEKEVVFETDHFSLYALEYENNINSNSPKVNERKIDFKDYKNLPDGEYAISVAVHNYSSQEKLSMADGAVVKPAKLVVKDGKYRVELIFKPLNIMGQSGYLGNLAYYSADGRRLQAVALDYYTEQDNFFSVYKAVFPERSGYPKVFTYPINKEDIDKNGLLKTRVNVFVPVMESITAGLGYQDALPVFDFKNLSVISLFDSGENRNQEEPKFTNQEVNTDSSLAGINTLNNNNSSYKGGQLAKLSKTGLATTGTLALGVAMFTLGLALLRKKSE